jgi:hypothetical protein
MEVTSILHLGFGKAGQAHGSNFRASIGALALRERSTNKTTVQVRTDHL